MQTRKFKRRVLVALGWNDPRTVRAIGQYAREAGWHLETRQFFTEALPARWRGEGLIVSNPQRSDLLAFMRRQAPLQPTVLIGGNQPGIRAAQVAEDNRAAGRLAARHFLDQGHKHFAWFTAFAGRVVEDRLEGYRAALAEAGFRCRLLEYRPQRKPVADWLAAQLRPLRRPLACYALDDQLAAELIEACLAAGWRVPEDVAVMGTGNIEIACECSHVPISSVDLAEEEIGRRAARLLDRLMRGGTPPAKPVIVPPRGVVARQSTEYLAVTDDTLRKAVDYLAENLSRAPSLEHVAAVTGISRRTLYNLFQRDLRRTPAAFVRQLRFERACRLLASPRQTVAEAARQCGFGSARTLSRLFRSREGLSAREWRRLQHNEAV